MEFRDILRSLDQLDEATKEVKGGRVHTAEPGGYGRQDDDDEDEDGKKIKTDKPAGEKRGRGRPPKEVSTRTSTGADAGNKKYSSDSLQKAMGIGKPSGKAKVTTKHKTSDKEPVGESMSLKGWFDKLDKELVKDFVIILKKAGDIDSIAKDALSDLIKRRRFEYRPEEDGNDRWVNRTDWEEHINDNIDEFEWTKSARDIAHDVVKSQGYIKFSKKHKFNSKDDIVMKELFYFIVTRPDFAKTAKMYLYKSAKKSIPSNVKAVNLKDLLPRIPI